MDSEEVSIDMITKIFLKRLITMNMVSFDLVLFHKSQALFRKNKIWYDIEFSHAVNNAVLKIRTCHARDLWKLARCHKQ